jgi:hypothetical protein
MLFLLLAEEEIVGRNDLFTSHFYLREKERKIKEEEDRLE